jgi:hypothetical protein
MRSAGRNTRIYLPGAQLVSVMDIEEDIDVHRWTKERWKKDGRKMEERWKEERWKKDVCEYKGTQNVRYAAQYRLGRCSFVLTVSTAHCAALNQL